MNITCIHLSARGSYIYTCTGGGEYTKNSLKKYNNRKTNTYLIIYIILQCQISSESVTVHADYCSFTSRAAGNGAIWFLSEG
jgi:hypothetical protein